jgi:hypothetical protein
MRLAPVPAASRAVPARNVQPGAMIEEADEVADSSTGAEAFKPMPWPSRGERSSQPTISRNASALAIENSSNGGTIAEVVDKSCENWMLDQSLTWSETSTISNACESNLDNDTIVSIGATIGLFKAHLSCRRCQLSS